jgi:hypothetical protein
VSSRCFNNDDAKANRSSEKEESVYYERRLACWPHVFRSRGNITPEDSCFLLAASWQCASQAPVALHIIADPVSQARTVSRRRSVYAKQRLVCGSIACGGATGTSHCLRHQAKWPFCILSVKCSSAGASSRVAMAQTAVVTGATGFVATELVKQLLAKVGTAAAGLSAVMQMLLM